MRLSEIAEIIIENVERLLPHLRDDVMKYLAMRKDLGTTEKGEVIGFQNLSEFPNAYLYGRDEGNAPFAKKQLDKWVDLAIEWALRSDPRYLRETKKGKSLDRVKAPFVRHVLKWWLDPTSGGIELPEDIETTAETLNQFNVAKQHGLNANVGDFNSFDELLTALQPFLSEEEADSDSYSRMGLELVFHDGPWKMYLVDRFIPGEKSTLHPGQTCHRAFEGTRWCVKYQSTFENTYSGTYYLVLYRGKRFGLINFPSKQFKNPQDQAISRTEPELGSEFLTLLFRKRPDFLAEMALAHLNAKYNYGDFNAFLPEFQDEMKDILDTPEAKDGALRDPNSIVQLAKMIGEWPNFQGWPEGYEKLISTDLTGNKRNAVKELVEAKGRIPEIEQRIPIDQFKVYCSWVAQSGIDPKEAADLIQKGRTNAIQSAMADPKILRSAVGWLSIERGLAQGNFAPWPEMEQLILKVGDPRAAYAYAKLRMTPWPEGEEIIASDERTKKAYEKTFGRNLATPGKPQVEPTDPAGLVNKAVRTGTELSEEQEDVVLQDIDAAIIYAREVIGPWPELEDVLRERGSRQQIQQYGNEVLYGEFQ